MNEQETQAVQAANARFYEAFQSLDLERMSAVWAPDAHATVVHPGWRLIAGRDAVMESWKGIFDNATMMHFLITGVNVFVEGPLAWALCTENITTVLDGQVSEGRFQATNIYTLRDGQWLMVHHHGSPVV